MQDSVIQESVPLARDGDTIAEVRSLSLENWEKELNSGRKLLLIGNSTSCVLIDGCVLLFGRMNVMGSYDLYISSAVSC